MELGELLRVELMNRKAFDSALYNKALLVQPLSSSLLNTLGMHAPNGNGEGI